MILFQVIIFENLNQILIYKTDIFTVSSFIFPNYISSKPQLIDASYDNIALNVLSKSV